MNKISMTRIDHVQVPTTDRFIISEVHFMWTDHVCTRFHDVYMMWCSLFGWGTRSEARLLKLNMKVCIQCMVPHGASRNTPTLRTLTSGCSMRTFVSQPVLCCQQWWEGVGPAHFYSTSCYSTLHWAWRTSVLRKKKKKKKQGDWQPARSQRTKHKCPESERGGAWLSHFITGP